MKRLSVNQAWTETAEIARRDGGALFVVMFAIGMLPTLLMQTLTPRVTPGQTPEPGVWMLLIIPVVVGGVIASLTVSTLALGRETVVRGAIGHAARRFLPAFVAALLLLLGFLLILFPLTFLLGPNPNNPASFARTFVVLGLFGLAYWTRFLLLNPVAAAEPVGPIALIRRTLAVSRGQFWRLLALLLLALLVFAVVSMAISFVAGLVIVLLAGRPEPGSLSSFLLLLVNGVLSTIFATLFTILIARVYAQLAEGGAKPTSGI